jgi:hypothetical protein
VASAEPSPWSHFAAHSVVSTAWEELGRAMPKQEAWQVLQSCEHMHSYWMTKSFLHIAGVAGLDAANGGRNRGGSSCRRRARDGGRLSESASSEGDEGSGVLHFDG